MQDCTASKLCLTAPVTPDSVLTFWESNRFGQVFSNGPLSKGRESVDDLGFRIGSTSSFSEIRVFQVALLSSRPEA